MNYFFYLQLYVFFWLSITGTTVTQGLSLEQSIKSVAWCILYYENYSCRTIPFKNQLFPSKLSSRNHYFLKYGRRSPSTLARTAENASGKSPFETFQVSEVPSRRKDFLSIERNLPLTSENVEKILKEVRPYLLADGGNCVVDRIDDGTVYVKLEGACGDCPSSSTTMKLGIERRLKESIPEIKSVEAVTEAAARIPLSIEGVEKVLDQIRPFLKFTGGEINVKSVYAPIEGVASSVSLIFSGDIKNSISQSVKVEIIQRLRRAFPGLTDVKISDAKS